jgi:hypothetical protein
MTSMGTRYQLFSGTRKDGEEVDLVGRVGSGFAGGSLVSLVTEAHVVHLVGKGLDRRLDLDPPEAATVTDEEIEGVGGAIGLGYT